MSVDGLTFSSRDEGTINGQLRRLNSGDPAPGFPLSQMLGPDTITVTAGSTVTLWQGSVSPLTTFDFLYVVTGDPPTVDALADSGTTPGVGGELELTCNNGDAAENIFVLTLLTGLPFRLFSDASRFNIAAGGNGFAGTADIIDLVRFKNTGSSDVKVTFAVAAA